MLKEAAACGVRLSLNGDNLALKASAKPSAALLAKLKAHKAEIVALLRQEQSDCCRNQINGDPDRRECRVCGKGNGEKKEPAATIRWNLPEIFRAGPRTLSLFNSNQLQDGSNPS